MAIAGIGGITNTKNLKVRVRIRSLRPCAIIPSHRRVGPYMHAHTYQSYPILYAGLTETEAVLSPMAFQYASAIRCELCDLNRVSSMTVVSCISHLKPI